MSNLKRFLALTLAMLMIVGGAFAVSAKEFKDVANTSKYFTAVDVLSNLGVIKGTSDTTYEPNAYVTREQAALLLAKFSTGFVDLFGKEEIAAPFSDCKDSTYFTAIAQCQKTGIIQGDNKDAKKSKFNPTGNIKYSEAVKMVVVALGYKLDTADNWILDYMFKANELGILGGFDAKKSSDVMSRGDMALLMYNAFTAPMSEYKTDYTYATDDKGAKVVIPYLTSKTIAVDVFKCEQIRGVVTATKNLKMDYYNDGKTIVTPKLSKSVTNGIIVANNADNQFNLAADVDAAALLGKEVSFLKKNGNVIGGLTTIGKDVEVTETAYNNADGARKVTLNGEVYNLNDYSEDRVIYAFNADGILARVDHANYDAQFKLLNGGIFEIAFNDNVDANDVIIYYPASVGKVGDNYAANKYIVGGKTYENYAHVNLNKTEAVKDDYVVYYANEKAGILKVFAKATKMEAQAAATVYSGNWKAIFGNSKTYEMLDTTALGNKNGNFFVAGQKFDLYFVNDALVYSVSYDPNAGKYNPKEYIVIDRVDKTTTSYGSVTYPYIYRNTAGSSTSGTISSVNGVGTGSSFLKAAYDYAIANPTKASYVGKIAVRSDSKIYAYETEAAYVAAANDNEYKKAFTSTPDKDLYKIFGAGKVEDGGAANLYKFNGNIYAMADYSKVLVRYSQYNSSHVFTGYEYVSYTGKDALPEIATTTKTELVIHTDSTVLNTVAFGYVETDEVRKEVEAGDYYVVVGINSWASSKEYYDVLNPATGDRIVATYSDADNYVAGKATLALGDMVRLSGSNIILSSVKKLATLKDVRYTDSGYFVLGDTAFGLKTDDTKIWGLNDDRNNYTARGTGDINAKNNKNHAFMEVDKNGKAIYVVFYNNKDTVVTNELNFNGNGGTGKMDAIAANPATVPANGFTRTGFKFVGWNTKADGTGANVAVGASYAYTTTTTLYAMWEKVTTFTVTYDIGTDPAIGVPDYYTQAEYDAALAIVNALKVSVEKDAKVAVAAPLTISSKVVFDGWFIGATKYEQGEQITVTGNVVLTAKWSSAT